MCQRLHSNHMQALSLKCIQKDNSSDKNNNSSDVKINLYQAGFLNFYKGEEVFDHRQKMARKAIYLNQIT